MLFRSIAAPANPAPRHHPPLPTLPTKTITAILLDALPPFAGYVALQERLSFLRVVALLSSSWNDWAWQKLMRNVALPDRATLKLWVYPKECDVARRKSSRHCAVSKRERAPKTRASSLCFGRCGVETDLSVNDLASALKFCEEVKLVRIFGPFKYPLRIGALP